MYKLYFLKSTIDNKVYIGITNNPERRYYEHINYTVEKNHYNGNWIRKTIRKGGKIKMEVIIDKLSKKEAIELEVKLIEMFKKLVPKSITNTAQGGLGFNHKGIPHSEEHKKSLEKAQPHKVRIPKDILYDLYVNKKLSKKKIGDIYSCGATTIDRRLTEYDIPIRRTANYKVSYKLDKDEILDLYLNKKTSVKKISEIYNIGETGIRSIIQREGIETGINKNKLRYDKNKLKNRYLELSNDMKYKMKIYDILSKEFRLSIGYLSKIIYKV
jgi:predicted GIY-YIG superfamily endonuclease